jgi:prepilin-type N-terminal cleavage/methylation domain-containing protein
VERHRLEALNMPMPGTHDDGFSLIEVMAGMMLLAIGALALAGAVSLGARRLTGSQDQLLASQRAAEAAESVFKARDNRTLTWAQIRNVIGAGADGGIFLDGPRNVNAAGPDGLINTADDGAQIQANMTRQIAITSLSPTLRQLQVIVRYQSPQGMQQFVLTTYLSQYA